MCAKVRTKIFVILSIPRIIINQSVIEVAVISLLHDVISNHLLASPLDRVASRRFVCRNIGDQGLTALISLHHVCLGYLVDQMQLAAFETNRLCSSSSRSFHP